MIRRTTFTLDEETITTLKQLARFWNISQAEVVRRAIASASKEISQKDQLLDRFESYWERASISLEDCETYLGEVAEERVSWRGSDN